MNRIATAWVFMLTLAVLQSASAEPGARPKGRVAAFVQTAAAAHLAQIEIGEVAEIHGRAAAVNRFGARMATDHGSALEELKRIATRERIPVPVALDAVYGQMKHRLESQPSSVFDRSYMDAAIEEHRRMIAAYREQAARGADPALRAYAQKTLPMLVSHLDLAEATETELQIHGE